MKLSLVVRKSAAVLASLFLASLIGLVIGCGTSGDTGAADATPETPSSLNDSSGTTLTKEKSDLDGEVAVQDPPVDVEPVFPTSLSIGDKAPEIHLAKFYSGDAVEKLEAGRIHVIEFWATWCAPCRTSMPHLSHLQELYGEKVIVIGITDEGQDMVGPFLAEDAEGQDGKMWAEVVNYRLAQDKKDWTNRSYMKAAGQTGIPSAFIVGTDGYIEWIGHPMEMDGPLEKVVDGTWDREAGARLVAAKAELNEAMQKGDIDKALAVIQRMEEASPGDPGLQIAKFQLLAGARRFEDAQAAAAELLDGDPSERHLNMMAWNIATGFPAEQRDLDLALQLATKANEITDENSAPVIDTLARVHYEREEFDEAVKWQEKAVLYGDKGDYQESLDKYKDEKDKPEIPETLTIGDPAPGVYASQWFTGEAVEKFEDDKVYVVEFWATWCGPCLASMPHLSGLQDKYGEDVVFVSFTKESEDVVGPFLKKEAQGQGGKTWEEIVTYRLAEDRHEWTNQSYMKAAKQGGIPTAFIVGKDQIVEWIGHPMQMDKPLEQIVAGDWDRAAAAEKVARAVRVKEAMAAVRGPMIEAQRAKDWDKVIELLAEVEEGLGEDAKEMAGMKFSFLSRAKKYEEAMALAKEFASSESEDSRTLNMVSWEIATAFPDEDRDLAVALEIAQKANTITDEHDAQVIDTLSRVYFEMGDFDKAIEWQEKAVEHGGNAYEKSLGEYKDAKEEAENPAAEEEEADSEDDTDAEDAGSEDLDSEEDGEAA